MGYILSVGFLMSYLLGFIWFIYFFYVGSCVVDFLFFGVGIDFSLSLVLDFLSIGFSRCVFLISSVVFFYGIFYMEGIADSRRFSWLVFLFVLSMGLLVFSSNFILVMVGWDGLGLISFCLVIFYSNSSSLESGLVTVFSNRVGDVFFLLGFFFFSLGGGFRFDTGVGLPFYFYLILFFGAITKRAQVPFSSWLPAAIAAPTPVSSLVHSSTLVTAGVYLLIRFNYVFRFLKSPFFCSFSLLTMILGGVMAVGEKDLKKVVAMSTLRQLGLMLFVLSVGLWMFCFIHIMVHAFFKRMLFLRTGSAMVTAGGGQDSRYFGRFSVSYRCFIYFLVRCICLSGFPFFIGFYSKDFILNSGGYLLRGLYYLVFMGGCALTVVYRVRLFRMTFGGSFKNFVFVERAERGFF